MPTFSMGGRAGGGRAQFSQHAPGTHLLVLGVHLLIEELAAHVDVPQLRQQVVELVISYCWQDAASSCPAGAAASAAGLQWRPPATALHRGGIALHRRLLRRRARAHLLGVAAFRVGGDVGLAAVDVGADPVEAYANLQACTQGRSCRRAGPRGHRCSDRAEAVLSQVHQRSAHSSSCYASCGHRWHHAAATTSTHRPGRAYPVVVVLRGPQGRP